MIAVRGRMTRINTFIFRNRFSIKVEDNIKVKILYLAVDAVKLFSVLCKMFGFLFSWIQEILDYFAGKKAKVVFLGLANAGKSTLMDLLRDGRLKQHPPTFQTRSTEMKLSGVTFTVYDLGGHVQARRVWRDYFPAVDAVVFVIDAADRDGFSESRQELHRLLADDDISEVPVLILGNKIDCRYAADRGELAETFGLHMFLTGKDGQPREQLPSRPVELFMSSLVGKQGYGEAFRWLNKYV